MPVIQQEGAEQTPVERLRELMYVWNDLIAPVLNCYDPGDFGPDLHEEDAAVYLRRETDWLQGVMGVGIKEIPGGWEDTDEGPRWFDAQVDVGALVAIARGATERSVRRAAREFRRHIAFLRKDEYLQGLVSFPNFGVETGTIPHCVVEHAREVAGVEAPPLGERLRAERTVVREVIEHSLRYTDKQECTDEDCGRKGLLGYYWGKRTLGC